MPDIFLYRSQANVYTIILSDPTIPSSGSSVTVSALGNAAVLAVGSAAVQFGISVNVYGNVLKAREGSISPIATRPKIVHGTGTMGFFRRRKRTQ